MKLDVLLPRIGFFLVLALCGPLAAWAGSSGIDVGLAVRDVTPPLPIWQAGYAGRKKPADKIDQRLVTQALAMRSASGERFVFVALDNCEVSRQFMEPLLQRAAEKFQLRPGALAVISSHTHSAPVLPGPLEAMHTFSATDRQQMENYSRTLQSRILEAVEAALADLKPAVLEAGVGRATFAMNRRVFAGNKVVFGDNPDGPTDWEVPVLRIKSANGTVRAVVFGYGCHGTSVRTGEDWYAISGEYMAYARGLIEAHEPGAVALYFTGMGADSDPSPRGQLLHAKRHGLELAGAVIGVLDRPMRPVSGGLKMAFEELDLPLVDPPSREQLQKDAASKDIYMARRAQSYLKRLEKGESLPRSVKLPTAAVRLGDDLTFVLMGGEVVVDYSRRLKQLLAADHPWMIGYAYDVPCYIPSARVIKEGGYEADSSLIYYGVYGPFQGAAEDLVLSRISALVAGLRQPGK